MYQPVAKWLKNSLIEKFPKKEILVYDTHGVYLKDFLARMNIRDIAQYPTFEMKIDITGIIKDSENCDLVFVECKLNSIRLSDFSQLLGYSKVAIPLFSFIVSPVGFSRSVKTLFTTYKRYDVLSYGQNKKIRLFRWDESKNRPDYGTIIPEGSLF